MSFLLLDIDEIEVMDLERKSLLDQLAYVPDEHILTDDLGGLITVKSNKPSVAVQRYYIKPCELDYILKRVLGDDK